MDTSTTDMQSLFNRLMVTGGKATPLELASLGIDRAMFAEAYAIFARRVPKIIGHKPLIEAVGTPKTPGEERALNKFTCSTPVYPLCGVRPLMVSRDEHGRAAVREGDEFMIRLFLLRESCEFLVIPSVGVPPFTDDVGSVEGNLKALLRPNERFYEVRTYGVRERGRRPVDIDSLPVYLLEGLCRIYRASELEWQQGAGQARTVTKEMDDFLNRIALPD